MDRTAGGPFSAAERILEMIALGRPLPEVLDALVRSIEIQSDDGAICSVLLLDPDGKRLRHGSAPGLPAAYCKAIDGIEIGPRAGSCGTAAFTGETVIVRDIASDPLWADFRDLAAQHGLRACWSAPVKSADGKVSATFAIYYREPRSPSAADLEAIEQARYLAGIALERDHAELALRETEARYRQLIDLSPDAIFVHCDWRIVLVNRAMLELFRAERPEQLLGRKLLELIAPESRERVRERVERLYGAHEPAPGVQVTYLRADGSRFIAEASAAPFIYAGRPAAQVVARDVSERLDAEGALRASEERFRSLTSLSSDWYWEQDAGFRFTEFSGPGARANARGGDPLIYLGKARWEISDLEPLEGDWTAHRAQLERHEPFRDALFRRRMDDGTTRYMSVSGQPIFGQERDFRGYRGIACDITAQKRAEHLLRLEHSVTRGFAETPNAADALKGAIRAICEAGEWECGRYLWVDSTAGVLRFGEAWCVPNADIERYIEESRGMVYAPGVGLVGTVWQTQQPLWVPDIVNDPRVARPGLARAIGMGAALVVPVAGGGKPIGVLVFHSRQVREPEARLLQTVRTIGGQIGQFVQRAQAEQAVRESEARFRSLTSLSSDWYWETDAELRFSFVSDGIRRVRGVDPATFLGRRRWELDSVNDPEDMARHRADMEAHRPFSDFVVARRAADGSIVYVSHSGEPMFDENRAFRGYRGVAHDITARVRAEEGLARLAHYDTLTGLPNRALFQDRIRHAMTRADRGQTQLALMFLDLDRFKEINDSLGHAVGDLVLQEAARRIQACLRVADTVARLGGDEFTVLLEGVRTPEEISSVAQKVLAAFARPADLAGRELYLSTSIGVTVYPPDGDDPERLLKNADLAMYHAKQEGRNNFQFFARDMGARTEQRADLTARLRGALERGELVLHYQPQMEVSKKRIVGVEALVRWDLPGLGLVPPAQFISIADDTGLIAPIGDWVLREACRQCKAWIDEGFGPLRVAVNLSPRQFRQKDLPQRVGAVLRETGLPPPCLELEIAESTIMRRTEQTTVALRRLHELGVRISVDDFGTGYSSLAYLQRFPVQTLKIDQSFVRDVRSDRNDAAIVATIIALARQLGMKAVAEGVETRDQFEFLRQQSCDLVQGYLLGRPQPAAQIGRLLERKRRRPAPRQRRKAREARAASPRRMRG